jgi:hypothetical protein
MDQRQNGRECEKEIATPSFVGLVMTVQIIIIGFESEAYIIELAVIARNGVTKQSQGAIR